MRLQFHAFSSRIPVALIAHAWMALLCAIHIPSPAFADDDADQIRALIGTTWDKPESKVETDPVVVSGHHAVASWTQGARGGRALLRQDGGRWSVVLCSGDPLKEAAWLVEAGVPQPDANRMAEDLSAAEALVLPERRAKFSLFEGTIASDAGSHQPTPHHPHNH
jgi:hypothetical protein